LARFEFKSGIILFCFSFTFVSFRESRLLVSWCAGDRCGMMCSDEDRGRSRRPRTSRVLAGRAVERSGGTVCGLLLEHGD
jgi:hypothetical protein